MFLFLLSSVGSIVPIPPFQCKDYCGFDCEYYKNTPCELSLVKESGYNPKSSLQTQFPAIDEYSICPSNQNGHQLSSSFQKIYLNSVCSSTIKVSKITTPIKTTLVADTDIYGSGQLLEGTCPMLSIKTNDFAIKITNITINCNNAEPAIVLDTRKFISLDISNAKSNNPLLQFKDAQTANCAAENITAPVLLTSDVGTGTFTCSNVPHRIVFTSLINDVKCVNCNCLDIANMTDARYIESVVSTDTNYLFSIKDLTFRVMVVSIVTYLFTINVLVDK